MRLLPGITTRRRARFALLAALACAAALALCGCGTTQPPPVGSAELAEAQTFPYFRVYWVGPKFDGSPLTATDGFKGYVSSVGDSMYYGDCVQGKSLVGGGSCPLPLQVTTVIYALHSNSALGKQTNIVVRGVPAVIYDEGRSLEIYSGRVAIDIFSDSFAQALQAGEELRPLNAPGSAATQLPPPVYCPGLSGPVGAQLERVLANLPHQVCQHTEEQEAFIQNIDEPPTASAEARTHRSRASHWPAGRASG